MSIQASLKAAVRLLEDRNVQYALAGGLASSIYRAEERLTKDLDFAVGCSQTSAEALIKELKLTPRLARKADLDGGPLFAIKRSKTEVQIVVGRNPNNQRAIGIDFLLPSIPWTEEALKRAQYNRINFGFAEIPTLSVEDVIIAKLYSCSRNSKREKDIDDLRSIFEVKSHEKDLAYICGQMRRFELLIPDNLKEDVPKELIRTAKEIRRMKR